MLDARVSLSGREISGLVDIVGAMSIGAKWLVYLSPRGTFLDSALGVVTDDSRTGVTCCASSELPYTKKGRVYTSSEEV